MSNKPGSITIIQLTRIGDILQTIMAVKDIKTTNPELSLNLVARKRFAKPLLFILEKYFDNFLLLDSHELSNNSSLDQVSNSIETINSWKSNVVVNLSFSNSSAHLTTLLTAKFKLGMVTNEAGQVVPNGSWSEFVNSTVMRGPNNPFSLVDIFRFILGSKEKVILPKRNINSNQMIIHPFASQERKRWSPTRWTEIVYKVLKNNPDVNIILVGSESDLKDAEMIEKSPLLKDYKTRFRIECGSLSIEDLFKNLEKSFLFCGHDSMVGHLASLAGTQCLTMSLGNSRPTETSPYGLDNYVLSPRTSCFPCFPDQACENYRCHKDLSYKLVSECLQQLIDSNQISYDLIKKNTSPLHLSTADLFQTGLSKNGLLKLNNLSTQELTGHQLFHVFYRIVWLFLLENMEETSQYPKLNRSTLLSLSNFLPHIKHLYELSEFGKKYSRFILEEVKKEGPDIEYIKSCGAKIQEIDKLQVTLTKTAPLLSPIIDFFNIKKSKMEGENLVELCTSSFEIYHSLGSYCDIMYELIEKTIDEYKINKKTNSMKEAKE